MGDTRIFCYLPDAGRGEIAEGVSVRQWILNPRFPGSNPGAPASKSFVTQARIAPLPAALRSQSLRLKEHAPVRGGELCEPDASLHVSFGGASDDSYGSFVMLDGFEVCGYGGLVLCGQIYPHAELR